MDNHWPSDVVEFGAINITGFRIVDSNRRAVRDFHDSRKRLEPAGQGQSPAQSQFQANGLPAISVNWSPHSPTHCHWFVSATNDGLPHDFCRLRRLWCTMRFSCSSRPSIVFCARSRISSVRIICSDAATAAPLPHHPPRLRRRRAPTSPVAPCWTATLTRVGLRPGSRARRYPGC